jgi:hypothetical protein
LEAIMVGNFAPSLLSVTGMLAVVLSTAVVMATRAAAILVTILAAVLAAIFTTILTPVFTPILAAVHSAVFPSVLAARRFVGLAGHGDRGQQRAGYEEGSKQL